MSSNVFICLLLICAVAALVRTAQGRGDDAAGWSMFAFVVLSVWGVVIHLYGGTILFGALAIWLFFNRNGPRRMRRRLGELGAKSKRVLAAMAGKMRETVPRQVRPVPQEGGA